ncbi:MAG: tetratricopeptide repeat protein [Planctomycetes bacterium]|nr:tetratricopeptide repeat protein [Planctomycetota bacterium]MCB9903080.1 tetratricopeptide repeat protein [Planctomycetota bacterium]
MIRLSLPSFALVALLFAAPHAVADTIYLVDGSSVEDVEVGDESYEKVEYKTEGKRKDVAADQVLRIDYSEKPPLVDRGDDTATEGDVFGAIGDLQTYVEGHFAKGGTDRRFPWAPAYALGRLIDLQESVGNLDGVIAAADQLIANVPTARQTPGAHLSKAQAQYRKGDAAGATKTLGALESLVQTAGLSRAWVLEVQLGRVVYDDALKGSARRDKLRAVAVSAGNEFPVVASRANTVAGESLVEEQKYTEAEAIFREVVDKGKADHRTLAAAYTGLGDCLLQRGQTADGDKQAELLKNALLAYMRVVVVYEDQTQYVPKAMFYAARIFDQEEDEVSKERAQRLYRKIIYRYDGSRWAREANGFKK